MSRDEFVMINKWLWKVLEKIFNNGKRIKRKIKKLRKKRFLGWREWLLVLDDVEKLIL